MSAEIPAGNNLGTPPCDEWMLGSADPASIQLPPSRLEANRSASKDAVPNKTVPNKTVPNKTVPNKTVPNKNLAAGVLAVLGIVVLYIWDDLILAAPIIAVAGWLGAWVSFLIFAGLYGLGSFGLAMLAVRKYDEHSGTRSSKLAKFIEVQTSGRRGRFARRLVDGGKFAGFVISSVVLGAIATTWLIRYAGRSHGITRIAALSSVIFAITFVAGYAGIAALVF